MRSYRLILFDLKLLGEWRKNSQLDHIHEIHRIASSRGTLKYKYWLEVTKQDFMSATRQVLQDNRST